MNRLSMWLTVFALGAVPLTAAALDYGPNPGLLAAEGGAPQLPGVRVPDVSHGAPVKPDGAGDANAAQRTASPATANPIRPGPSARGTARRSGDKPATVAPHPAPWQSLLPGSIQ